MSNPKEPTTQLLSWRDYCLKQWGERYNAPEVAYKFGDAKSQVPRTFNSTDQTESGIYRRS